VKFSNDDDDDDDAQYMRDKFKKTRSRRVTTRVKLRMTETLY